MANLEAIAAKKEEFESDLAEVLAKHNAEISIDLDVIEVTFFSGVADTVCFTYADATGFDETF